MYVYAFCNTLCVITVVLQGEEGPPSLEYIQAKDLFPQKELVKEDDSLQVSCFLFSFFLSHDAPKFKFLAPKFRILWNNKKKKLNQKTQTDTVSVLAGTLFLLLYILPIESVAMWCIKSLLEWSLSIGPPLDT